MLTWNWLLRSRQPCVAMGLQKERVLNGQEEQDRQKKRTRRRKEEQEEAAAVRKKKR